MSASSAPSYLEPPIHDFAPPLLRFQGDGFDGRRPIMSNGSVAGPSTSAPNVIDLTSDDSDAVPSIIHSRQLPPLPNPHTNNRHRSRIRDRTDHFHHIRAQSSGENAGELEIIGDSDLQMSRQASQQPGGHTREDSDDSDVVFVGSRQIPGSSNRSATLRPPRITSDHQAEASSGAQPAMSSFTGIGHLTELIRNRTMDFFTPNGMPYSLLQNLTAVPRTRFGGSSTLFTAFDHPATSRTGHVPNRPFDIITETRVQPGTSRAPTMTQTFPARLDFEAQGFDWYNEDVTFQGANMVDGARNGRAESPPYKAPGALPEGFTRKVDEDLIIVCPNCNEELGAREHDEEKRQIWVVKACGHVYCGECTRNRAVTKNKKDGKTPTFKKCVVDGCDKPVASQKAMLQIYL